MPEVRLVDQDSGRFSAEESMTTLHRLPVLVSPEQYEVISQAMMLKKRSSQQLGQTDGEVLAAVCRAWLASRGVQVEPTKQEA